MRKWRRIEVVNDLPAVQDLMARWPALFSEAQVNPATKCTRALSSKLDHDFVFISHFRSKEESRRITTIHLERTFLSKLDWHMTKLVDIFQKKGGVAGMKIKPLLDSLSEA